MPAAAPRHPGNAASAVGEACANVVEHAYRGGEPGRLHVTADVDVDGLLTVTVRDEGTWRPPNGTPATAVAVC